MTIREKIEKLKAGTFHSYTYESDMPVKAKFKEDISIKKVSVIVARTGVKYTAVKACPELKHQHNPNKVEVVKNRIFSNTNTKRDVVQLYPRIGQKRNVSYIVEQKGVSKTVNQIGDYEQYLNKHSSNPSPIITLFIDKITAIR